MVTQRINRTTISITPSQHRVTFRFSSDMNVVAFSFFRTSDSENKIIHDGVKLLNGHRSFRLIFPLEARYFNPEVRFMLIVFQKAENGSTLIKKGNYQTSYSRLCNRSVVRLNL